MTDGIRPVELDIHDPIVTEEVREQIYDMLDNAYRSAFFNGDTITFTIVGSAISVSIRPQVRS